MTLYIDVSWGCDNCELETNSFPSIKEGVITLRGQGWTMNDEGHEALCEECTDWVKRHGGQVS